MSTFVERLPCKLSPEEISQKGHALVDCMRRKVQLEAQKAELAAEIKLKIKANDQRAAELAQHYDTGIEYREVVCEAEKDFEHCCIRTFRRDTNELLHTRIMRPEERQAELDYPDGEGEQAEAPARGGHGDEQGPGEGEDDDSDDEFGADGESTGAISH